MTIDIEVRKSAEAGIIQGKSNSELSREMGVSRGTIQNLRYNDGTDRALEMYRERNGGLLPREKEVVDDEIAKIKSERKAGLIPNATFPADSGSYCRCLQYSWSPTCPYCGRTKGGGYF